MLRYMQKIMGFPFVNHNYETKKAILYFAACYMGKY